MKKLALHWKIIIGMVLGVFYGIIANNFGWVDFTNDWIKPWGKVFVNLLKLIAVPLVFASLVKGVASLSDISKLSRIGGKTIAIYLVSTVISVTIGLFLVNMINPGADFDKEKVAMTQANQEGVNNKIEAAGGVQEAGPLQFMVDVVPTNIFESASDNRNMLQVIFFAIFFGIALILIPQEKARPAKEFFDSFNSVILKLIDFVMLAAPYGVFGLLASLVVESPSIDLFKALGMYAITLIIGLFLMIIVYAIIVKLFTNLNPFSFIRGISPAQLLAFSTSSSAATLPATMDCVENNLSVDKEVSSFVLPIGATINMDGTSLYQAVAAVFIAQTFGMDLSFGTQMGIVLTATLASIGAAAVPSAGMVMLVIVLSQAGIPEAGLALIFAVDRPLDMCRTITNVTGDAAVSMLVAKSMGKLKKLS